MRHEEASHLILSNLILALPEKGLSLKYSCNLESREGHSSPLTVFKYSACYQGGGNRRPAPLPSLLHEYLVLGSQSWNMTWCCSTVFVSDSSRAAHLWHHGCTLGVMKDTWRLLGLPHHRITIGIKIYVFFNILFLSIFCRSVAS